MHHALKVVAHTSSIEHAYLLGAICRVLDEPAGRILHYWEQCPTSTSAYNLFYKVLQALEQHSTRAHFDGSSLGLFSARVICLPEANPDIIQGYCGDKKMCLIVPKFERLIESIAPQFCPAYFAYAYFYESGGRISIGAMRAPLWDYLPEKVRETYAQWPEVLIAAIEHRALRESEKERFITGPDEHKRIRRIAERVAVDLALLQGRVYGGYLKESGKFSVGTEAVLSPLNDTILPNIEAAGYRELSREVFLSRVQVVLGNVKPEHVLFKHIPLPHMPRSKADETESFRDCFKPIPNVTAHALARAHRQLFPMAGQSVQANGHIRHSFPVLPPSYQAKGGTLEGIGKAAAMAPVHVEPLNLGSLDFEDLANYYHKSLTQGLMAEALQRIPRHFAPISAGPRGSARQDWWNLPGEIKAAGEFVHLAEQNRHPTLHYALPSERGLPSMLCIGFKGAGFLDTDGLPLRNTKFLREGKLHSPILRNPRKTNTVHADWGGLDFFDAQTEFNNLLGLNYLMSKVAPRLGLVAAQPLDIASIEAIPLWDDSGRIQWISPEEHALKVLGQKLWAATPKLACLRTVSVSDVRLSQIVNRIFSPPDIEKIEPTERKPIIDSTLRYLYRVHGYQFEAPKFPVPLQDGKLTAASVAWYLKLAADTNPRASSAIFHRFESKLFVTMAAVHAIGGHLGGFNLPGQDSLAIRGGPLTLRNLGADGLMHDVDHFCHLPLTTGWGSKFKKEQHIYLAQALDKITLLDTIYWLNLVLGQRESLPSQGVGIYHYGPHYSERCFRDDKAAIEKQIALVKRSLDSKEKDGVIELAAHMEQPLQPQYDEIRAKALNVLKREPPRITVPKRPVSPI
jgi:hypothetical protein